jgi:tRNA(Ile)-lysidine synthase TilS/MesJ
MFEISNKLYKNLDSDILLTSFSHLEIPFDKKWKRVAVNLSGGADSALLTYLLCKIIDDNNLNTQIDIITYQRCWETRPWQGYIAQQVYMWFKNRFPKIVHKRHLTFIPPELEHGVIGPIINGRSGDQIIVGSFNKFAAWEYKLDAVYNATSKNPDDLREDRMKNRDKDAGEGVIQDLWNYNKSVQAVFAHPFKFVKKDWIVAQYHLHGILDLYKTTRSCEGDINHHDVMREAVPHFSSYTPGMKIPTCDQCWWCEERSWAENRVEQIIQEING